MKKIKIYTCSHNRPDFIRLQYETMKKHIKDDFEFIVFNNERPGGDGGYDPNKISEIEQICESIGVQSIRVELDPDLQILGGSKMFEGQSYLNGNVACAYSLTWAWKKYIINNDCLSVFIDSDMFFIKNISFEEKMEGYNFGYIPSYRYERMYVDENNRGKLAFKYPWSGLILFKPKEMPNPNELSFGCGYVNGIPTDVGGEAYEYVEKYKDQLKTKYIDQWGLLVDVEAPYEINLNGCAQMFADFEQGAVEIKNYQESNLRTFPHQIDRQNYWEYLYKNFNEIIEVCRENNFPKPTFVDMLKFETDDDLFQNAFIFHYKNASNTLPWMKGEVGEVYNKDKTECLIKFLSER
jgi:hypothetical protein